MPAPRVRPIRFKPLSSELGYGQLSEEGISTYIIAFSEAVTGLELSDFSADGVSITNLRTDDNKNWTLDIAAELPAGESTSFTLEAGSYNGVSGGVGEGNTWVLRVKKPVAPPKITSMTATPAYPKAGDTVTLVIDFSEAIGFQGDGILLNGVGNLGGGQEGLDFNAIEYDQVDADTYRVTMEMTPNERYIEGELLKFVLPTESYISAATQLPGENTGEVTLNELRAQPPKLLAFTVVPESPTAGESTYVTLDFSEPTTLTGAGVLANGEEDIAQLGFDVGAVTQEQVDPDTYRWVVELIPNDNYVEGETIELTLPAANYKSTVTNLSGEEDGLAVINPPQEAPPNTEDSNMNHILWHQGHVNPVYPNCGGCKEGSPPSSNRIAAEYHRGMYTLTNVIYPYTNQYNPSNLGPLKDCLDKVNEGDVVFMSLVPPMHRIIDAAMFTYDTLEPGSTLGSLAGMEVSLVTAPIDADGNVGEIATVAEKTTLPGATTAEDNTVSDPEQVFIHKSYADMYTEVGKWQAFGIKVTKLPEGVTSLSEIKAGIAVAVHALGFDAQIQMG